MRTRKTKTSIEKLRGKYFNNLTSQIFRELIARYSDKMTSLGRGEEIKYRTKLCENLEIPYEVFRNIYDRGIGQINYILLTIEKCNAIGLDISDIFSTHYFTKLGQEASKIIEEQTFIVDEIILPEM